MGIRIAVDDFGTGYSNLGYLPRLPLHTMKLAGVLIDGLRQHTTGSASIVASLISLAHALGLAVTAEGVETQAQAERLRIGGCDRPGLALLARGGLGRGDGVAGRAAGPRVLPGPGGHPLPLRGDHVARVARGGDPRLEHAEPLQHAAGQQGQPGSAAAAPAAAAEQGAHEPGRGEVLRRTSAAGAPTPSCRPRRPARAGCPSPATPAARPPPRGGERRAGPASGHRRQQHPQPAELAAAEPVKTNGRYGCAPFQAGTAVCDSSTAV